MGDCYERNNGGAIKPSNITVIEPDQKCVRCLSGFTDGAVVNVFQCPCKLIWHGKCFDKYVNHLNSEDMDKCATCRTEGIGCELVIAKMKHERSETGTQTNRVVVYTGSEDGNREVGEYTEQEVMDHEMREAHETGIEVTEQVIIDQAREFEYWENMRNLED